MCATQLLNAARTLTLALSREYPGEGTEMRRYICRGSHSETY